MSGTGPLLRCRADTPGLVLIKVHAIRIHYWDGEDEGEVAL